MKSATIALLAAAGLLLPLHVVRAEAPAGGDQDRYTAEAREAVGTLVKTLGGELKKDIKELGAENAIGVCKEKAPKIAKSIAEEKGVMIRRVTTKNRNPKSVPDPWEAKVLQDFEQKLAQGARPDSLEHAEVVDDGGKKTFRYMKGLVIQELCMTCHGTKETIPEAVKAKLAAEYPDDKATGYLPNMLRGAVSLQRPL